MLRVRTLDRTVRTLMVENSKTVQEIMDDVCKKIGIPNTQEFSLAFQRARKEDEDLDSDEKRIQKTMKTLARSAKLNTDDSVHWLQHQETLLEQGVLEEEVLLMQKKYFGSDEEVTKE